MRELEAAILASPGDPAPYLVLADWLQARNDPRGELIALQHAERLDAAATLLAAHEDALLGPLVPFLEQGRPEWAKRARVEWRWGFVRELTIAWSRRHDSEASARAELAAILAHPSLLALEALSIEQAPEPPEDDAIISLQCLVDAIASQPPRALRRLSLGKLDRRNMSFTASGNFAQLVSLLPELREVAINAGNLTIGRDLALPQLRSFAVRTGTLRRDDLADLRSARWPMLERLEIWFGDPYYGATCTVDDLVPLLARDLPHLRHLGLCNCPWADEIALALADCPLLGQLTSLDLSEGALTDEGAAVLASAIDHLDQLDVSENGLGEASRALLAPRATYLLFDNQHPERARPRAPGWELDPGQRGRYCTVGE